MRYIFQREHFMSYLHIETGSQNLSSSKTRMYLFYIVNIMGISNHDIHYIEPN